MAMHAHPVPIDPYVPVPPVKSEESEIIRHPSPFVPIRLPVFAVVMWLNDLIVKTLTGGGRTLNRSRTFSDPTESVEEGGGVKSGRMGTPSKASQPAIGRISIGGRRKVD